MIDRKSGSVNQCRVLYRRGFDWFQLVYTVVLLGLFFWVFWLFDGTPLRETGFWFLVVILAVGQGIYFIIASRSPYELAMDGDDLVVKFRHRRREIRVPSHLVRCDKSPHFSNGYTLWCAGKKVLLLADRTTIENMMEAIQANQRAAGNITADQAE